MVGLIEYVMSDKPEDGSPVRARAAMNEGLVPADWLQDFMIEFLGYGNLGAPIWFIGMEEGGGNSLEEIQARLTAWNQRGRRHVEDLHDFCQATGHPALLPYATTAAPYNPTWCGLIKHLHEHLGIPLASAVEYQRTSWLTKGEDNCLLNLMPLPSPNVDTWHYNEWSDLPELQSRQTYLNTMVPKRIARLRRVITNFKPKTVICVGTSYRHYWEQLIQGISTTKLVITHPAARHRNSYSSTRIVDRASAPVISNSLAPSSLPVPSRTEDKLGRFFASSARYHQLGTVAEHPVYIGYEGRGNQTRRLCIELKEIDAPSLRTQIVQSVGQLQEQICHPIQWQPTGKTASGRGILALYFEDRPDINESEARWAQRYLPLFFQISRELLGG